MTARRAFRVVAALLSVATPGFGAEPSPAGPEDLKRRLALAATAAAEATLRLHETASAKGWLGEVPVEHRGSRPPRPTRPRASGTPPRGGPSRPPSGEKTAFQTAAP